jgi:hypothetical protein
MGKKPKKISDRRKKKRKKRSNSHLVTAGLVVGMLLATVGFFRPWFAVKDDALGMMGNLLVLVGALPEIQKPICGYEIPSFLERDLSHPLLQGVTAFGDLFGGKVDRFGARLFLGERSESAYGALALVPLTLVLFSLGLLRFPRARLVAALLATLCLAGWIAMLWWWKRVTGPGASPPLHILHGYHLSLGGVLASHVGCVLHFLGPLGSKRTRKR